MSSVSSKLSCRILMNVWRRYPLSSVSPPRCWYSVKKSVPDDEEENRPLPFSKSKAASWHARTSFSGRPTGKTDDEPWFQPLSISLSIFAVLVWFCVLREESDVDLELDKSLYQRVEGLEKKQLELSLRFNQDRGLETKEIHKRLSEINSQNN